MRILTIDIETSPNVADVWGLWQQNVGLNQLHESTRMLCFAAKWHGSKKTEFFSEWGNPGGEMVAAAWNLLNDADAVVHFNGDRFDVPHINREFIQADLGPASPFKSIDVLKIVKKNFKFPSNKLQYVSTALGFEGKLAHTGHSLWTDVLRGEPKAQKLMQRYNVQDVVLLEKVYDKLIPWMHNGLNANLFGNDGCPNCGSGEYTREGYSYTNQGAFQRYQCKPCGKWFKDTTRVDGTKKVGL
jgi:DNA polymerase elongation subunit (family B)